MSISYINLPGIYGSDENHWHSIWERNDSSFKRFSPSSWDYPDLSDWLQALDYSIETSDKKVVLVAHSLACLLVAHWSAFSQKSIGGALLVSVPDPQGSKFPSQANAFASLPNTPLRFPACIVASRNDPYGEFDYMKARSLEWGCGLVDAGENGHIGSEVSKDGWQFGQNILTAFSSGLR